MHLSVGYARLVPLRHSKENMTAKQELALGGRRLRVR